MAVILIVEDDPSINELLYRNLSLVGHQCSRAYDGNEAFHLLENAKFDLLLLDILLPALDGLTLMQRRPDRDIPVILITARDSLSDKVQGLSLGADDYIVKPFEILEVVARIQAVLRRTKRNDGVFCLDDVRVDFDSRQVFYCGECIELTPQEFALLEVLVVNRNLALSREKLLELAWGYDYFGDTRTVDVHIQKLRKKLGIGERIKTVYKLGYRLETPR
jgi:two-component system, OmpR family, alkaline phosphatase synthesis response regulator PhoP